MKKFKITMSIVVEAIDSEEALDMFLERLDNGALNADVEEVTEEGS